MVGYDFGCSEKKQLLESKNFHILKNRFAVEMKTYSSVCKGG